MNLFQHFVEKLQDETTPKTTVLSNKEKASPDEVVTSTSCKERVTPTSNDGEHERVHC